MDGSLSDLIAPLDLLAPGPAPPSYGLGALDLERLPFIRSMERAGHQSSYDRSGGNTDWGNFVGTDASGDKILLDLKGPGCVYRTWFTGFAPADYIKVYFDGELQPRINLPLSQLFAGQHAPFSTPLVGNDVVSSGGFFSYLPLLFNDSIRITSNATSGLFYYNFDYHQFPPDTVVPTWTGKEDATQAVALLDSNGADPKADAGNAVVTGTVSVPSGSSQTLLDVDGPRSISAIHLALGGSPSTDLLNNARLRITWDGESAPSVDAPLGALCGAGEFGAHPVRGLGAGMAADGSIYVYFPMPFRMHAKVQIINSSTVSAASGSFEIRHKPFQEWNASVGYFRAQVTGQHPTVTGVDIPFLEVDGMGQVVAVGESVTGPSTLRFLEGDERAVIDDSGSPAIHGTGTEDFFNGGWYFNRGPFSLATHGNTVHAQTNQSVSIAAYREFIGDAIPFRRHIRLSIEHGDTDQVSFNVDAWTVALYYSVPSPSMTLSDELRVGDASSEASHKYNIKGATWAGQRTFTFEGEHDALMVSQSGRAHQGSSEFDAAISSSNTGVVLRRLFDQGVANQEASVYVDGALVGTFYRAGGNTFHNWREEDFLIPGSFTKGKSTIHVLLKFSKSDRDWNEFRYRVYSLS